MRERLIILLLALAAAPNRAAIGETQAQPSEYQIKAAFLYNFVKFVDWPPTPLEQNGPLLLCVVGKDPFDGALDRATEGKNLNGRQLAVRKLNDLAAARACHVLFVSQSESGRLPQLFKAIEAWSVLTVSETDRFCELGGMVNFFMEGRRVRFQINSAAAARSGLKISSRLLQLAISPPDKGRE